MLVLGGVCFPLVTPHFFLTAFLFVIDLFRYYNVVCINDTKERKCDYTVGSQKFCFGNY